MAAMVTCTKCGSQVPDRRNRCGRCGSTAITAAAGGATSARTRLITIGSGAAVVGVVAIAALMAGVPGRTPSKSAVAVTPATAKASSVEASGDEASGESEPAAYSEAVTSDDHSRSGLAAYNTGDLGKAAEQLEKAVEADPDNAESLNNLGQVLVRSGKARDAIAYFDRAIAIAADVWAYRFNRARAFAEMQDWPKAIAGYTEAARMFPGDYVTQFNLAKARQANGDLPGAVEAYGKAAQLAPGQGDFQLWYGRALDQSGRQQDAVAAYRRFLELEPEAPQAEKVKARLAQMGQPVTKTPSQTS